MMKRLFAMLCVMTIASHAQAQGAQLPQPTINDALKTSALNLGADLFISLMRLNPTSSPNAGKPFMIGTCNTVLFNVENKGGDIFPNPVELTMTAKNSITGATGPIYRYVIDGTTKPVTPPGHKIYVITFRDVRVGSGWGSVSAGWSYEGQLKTITPRGTRNIANTTNLSVGSNLQTCSTTTR